MTSSLPIPSSSSSQPSSSSPSIPSDPDSLPHRYEELKRHYRILAREHRGTDLELRDLKKEHMELLEAYYTSATKLSNTERFKYQQHFDLLNQKALHYQSEYRKREEHLAYLTQQTREANHAKDGVEEDKRRLERRVRAVEAELTEARDDLLRLQPRGAVADSEVSSMYQDLCQQISTWVDDQTEDIDILEANFANLSSVDDLPELLRGEEGGIDKRRLGLAKKHPECLPLLMQAVVHAVIGREVLDPAIFLFGLHDEHVDLLRGIEEGMAELKPKRGVCFLPSASSHFVLLASSPGMTLLTPFTADTPTILHHRSETLSSILAMPAFTTIQRTQSESLAQSLASALSVLVGGRAGDGRVGAPSTTSSSPSPISWPTLHTTLIAPAVALSNKIRIASTAYTLFNPHTHTPTSKHAVGHSDIARSQMIDCATQKVVRADSAIKVADDGSGRIGEEMFVVSPGLVRAGCQGLGGRKASEDNDRGGERSVLVKPTVLIRLDAPMGKKKSGIKMGLGTWLGLGGGGGGGGGEEVE